MTDTGQQAGGRTSTLGVVLVWIAIGWGVGVWQGWWTLGPWSIAVAVLIALGFVREALRRRGPPPPPTTEVVRAETERLLRNAQGRQLRHLVYQVAAAWPNERGDDAPWTGVKFFVDPLALILRVGVSEILDEENRTPALVQAYAKNHYENQLGMKVVRNEIATLADHWCVVTEAVGPDRGCVRRYGFSLHLSEYVVQFTFPTENHLATCESFVDAVVSRCWLKSPSLVDRVVLRGRIVVGIPQDWSQTIDEERTAAWRALPGPLDVRIDLVPHGVRSEIDETVLERVPGYERPAGAVLRPIRIDENGVSGLRLQWSSPAFKDGVELVMDAVRVPGGPVVVLTTRNHGRGDEVMKGFTVDAMRLELLASLRPADAPIL